jgi:hypothetical protein
MHSSKEMADWWRHRARMMTAVSIGAVVIAAVAVAFAVKATRASRIVAVEPTLVKLEPAPLIVAAEPPMLPVMGPPPKKETTKVELTPKEHFLEALGSLSVSHLYQSYLNVGLLADGVENETYTVKEAEETLRSITDLMDQVDDQLIRLSKLGLDADDRAALEQINAVSVMLRLQSRFLQDYWKSDAKSDADKYHEVRKAAWTGLQKIMEAESN